MFAPTAAFRTATRRVVAPIARRTFSVASAAKVAKNENARKALIATAGAAIAMAAFQQEVCCLVDRVKT
jgi:hypothetical protein